VGFALMELPMKFNPREPGASGLARLWSYLALFASVGTIVCCALPLALVMLGLGAAWAALIADAPWLVALSHHKGVVFTVAGTLIFSNLIYVYLLAPQLKGRSEACSIDAGANACDVASRVSQLALWASVAIWLIGFSVAYLLPLAMSA